VSSVEEISFIDSGLDATPTLDARGGYDTMAGDTYASDVFEESPVVDAGNLCPPPATLPIDGGGFCTGGQPCYPAPPDGGICYGVPANGTSETSVEIWVQDTGAPGGGWRIPLAIHTPATFGGHTYEDRGDGLFGQGNGIYGDIIIARDGVADWMGFHFDGLAAYHGGGVWDWPAALTVSQRLSGVLVAVGRRFSITRVGPPCPPYNSGGTYTFLAEDPPRDCTFGVDILSFVIPGQ
jgi:hypothetical protein